MGGEELSSKRRCWASERRGGGGCWARRSSFWCAGPSAVKTPSRRRRLSLHTRRMIRSPKKGWRRRRLRCWPRRSEMKKRSTEKRFLKTKGTTWESQQKSPTMTLHLLGSRRRKHAKNNSEHVQKRQTSSKQ